MESCLVLHEGDTNTQEDKHNYAVIRGRSPISTEFSQPKRTRTVGQCNLRTSLAWDKAFFTNEGGFQYFTVISHVLAGVLNAEELSILNKTFNSPKQQLLPEIEEELRTSIESNASFVSDDLTLQDLEGNLLEQTQAMKQKSEDQTDETYNVASICSRTDGSKQRFQNERDDTCAIESVRTRKGGNKQNSENKAVNTHDVAVMNNRTGGIKHRIDEIGPKCEEFANLSTEEHCSSQPKNTGKKSSTKCREEPQKSSVKQPKSASGNNDSPASTSLTKKISSVSKRVKDTLGRVLPANMGRTSVHRISPRNVQDDSRVSARSIPSPNSSASESPAYAKLTRCHSYTSYERFAKPASGTTMEAASGINFSALDLTTTHELSPYLTDDTNSTFHSSVSPESSLDGMSSLGSPTNSTKSMTIHLKSNVDNVASLNQFTSAIDVSSTESQVLQCNRQRHGLQNSATGGVSLANVHTLAKGNSNMVHSIATRSVLSDDSVHDGSRSKSYRSKPSGLRMPSPKIGFFDPASTPIPRNSSSSHEKSTVYSLDKKILPHSGMNARPPRLTSGGSVSRQMDLKPKLHGIRSIRPLPTHTSVRPHPMSANTSIRPSYGGALKCTVPSASHLRPDTPLKSYILSSPAQLFQPQLKSNTGVVSMSLLAQPKPELSCQHREGPSGRSSDWKQLSLDDCKKEDAITAEVRNKLYIQSDSFDADQQNKGNFGRPAGESQCQLDSFDVNATLQDGSEPLGCGAIFTNSPETVTASEHDKTSERNAVIGIHPGNSEGSSILANDIFECSELDSIKSELLLSPTQIETQSATERDVSEDFPFPAITRIEIECSHSLKNEPKIDACSQVSQAVDQVGHLDKMMESRISNLVCSLQLRHEDKPNQRESIICVSLSDGLNTELLNDRETFRSLSQCSNWPVYEDVVPFLGEESNANVPASMKFDQLSVSLGAPVDFKPLSIPHEIKASGRSPLAVNCDFSSAPDRQESQKLLKREKGSIFAFAKKAAKRFTSLNASFPVVLADISGQENSMPEEGYIDHPLHKIRRRKSLHNLSDEKQDMENPVGASAFSEENSALEAMGESIFSFDMLDLESGAMQNSIIP
eukprot:Gb_32323 [translate_table: standard]